MKQTFSKLDFWDRRKEENVKKMFKFLDKNINPVRKKHMFLEETRRNSKPMDYRHQIKFYDSEEVLREIDDMYARNTGHLRSKHNNLWSRYADEIRSLCEDNIQYN